MIYQDFQAACETAKRFGAKLPKFASTHPIAQSWIDRALWIGVLAERNPRVGELQAAIEEANRYVD